MKDITNIGDTIVKIFSFFSVSMVFPVLPNKKVILSGKIFSSGQKILTKLNVL